MDKVLKCAIKIAAVGGSLFAASIVVYMLNLDMKLMAAVQPMLEPIYDRIEREPMP